MHRRRIFREYLESFILAVIVVIFVRSFVAEAVQVPTGSMEDTLLPGDHLFINKFTFRDHLEEDRHGILPFVGIKRKDIVVFRFFEDSASYRYYVKRVIGLPGETLEIRAKQVYINGVPLDEPYAVFKNPSSRDRRIRDVLGPIEIPVNHFFVMGDNRDRSYDSRYWGPLPREQIIGRPLVIWWSLTSIDSERAASPSHRSFIRFLNQIRWDRVGKAVR
jgi:signal peptidase I